MTFEPHSNFLQREVVVFWEAAVWEVAVVSREGKDTIASHELLGNTDAEGE